MKTSYSRFIQELALNVVEHEEVTENMEWHGETMGELTARTSAVPVSIEPSRVSPILIETTCAPGAIPHFSTSPSKYPAAIHATCVPCAPDTTHILRACNHRNTTTISWPTCIREQP